MMLILPFLTQLFLGRLSRGGAGHLCRASQAGQYTWGSQSPREALDTPRGDGMARATGPGPGVEPRHVF